MYEACAIEHYNTTDSKHIPTWWPFFYCMEKSGKAADTTTASGCAKNNGLDWTVITTCSTTTAPQKGSTADGNPLMHNIALATQNLVPPHQWTPWVVVNGSPLTSAQLDLPLTPIICKAYTSKAGCTAPAGCNGLDYAEIKLDYKN
jgi:interferon gamma-inducible protein 30